MHLSPELDDILPDGLHIQPHFLHLPESQGKLPPLQLLAQNQLIDGKLIFTEIFLGDKNQLQPMLIQGIKLLIGVNVSRISLDIGILSRF